MPGTEDLVCTLRVTIIPGGEIGGVEIINSSGDPTFDRQAENAVRKAAPLPFPTEPRLMNRLRKFTLDFDPRDL